MSSSNKSNNQHPKMKHSASNFINEIKSEKRSLSSLNDNNNNQMEVDCLSNKSSPIPSSSSPSSSSSHVNNHSSATAALTAFNQAKLAYLFKNEEIKKNFFLTSNSLNFQTNPMFSASLYDDDMPMDLSAKKSRLSYYSATVAAAAAMAAIASSMASNNITSNNNNPNNTNNNNNNNINNNNNNGNNSNNNNNNNNNNNTSSSDSAFCNISSSSSSSSCSTCESPSPSSSSSACISNNSFSPPPLASTTQLQSSTQNQQISKSNLFQQQLASTHFLQSALHHQPSFLSSLASQTAPSLLPYFLSQSFNNSHHLAALQSSFATSNNNSVINNNPSPSFHFNSELSSALSSNKQLTSPSSSSLISSSSSSNYSSTQTSPNKITSTCNTNNNTAFNASTMRKYLKERKDQGVLIIHAKVAQKSYGNEKRFFCPPPCVYLLGNTWKTSQQHQQNSNTNSKGYQKSNFLLNNSNTTDTPNSVCTFIGINNSEREMQPLLFDTKKNFAAAKTMFISDSDKRKHFKLLLRAYYKSGLEIGSFFSNNIKVISKPSKKKQSVKNSDLCIASGTRIALFNRLRSQTVSTRYLFCENGVFYASSQQWGSFLIYLIEDNGCESEEFVVKEGYIHYGSTVKLVCTVTGMALPRLVIRKVDKSQVVLDASDALSQLHKCAFYIKDSDHMYLCLSQDKIIQFQATGCSKESNKDIINDGACWTIISTDEAKYSWCETLGPPAEPVTPIPIIHSLKNHNEDEKHYIDIKGENFNSNLKVWLDDNECETIFKCSNSMRCIITQTITDLLKSNQKSGRNPNNQKASICLVRHHDGIIYNTGFYYNFYSSSMSKQNIDLAARIFNSNSFNSNNTNNKDNPTIYMPRPSLKRHSMN